MGGHPGRLDRLRESCSDCVLRLLTLFAFIFIASGLWAFKAIITAGLQG
jgi:hypothetical protein